VPAGPVVIERDEEATRVFHWRVSCFLDDKFTLRQARRLANHSSDHHEAEALLAAGCPAELVVRLLT
jgi:hypothetical protein